MNQTQKKIYDYFQRDPELRVLFIFNNPFLNAEMLDVTWDEGYRYVVFKGDWFTCKYRLDKEWANDRVILYFESDSPLRNKLLRKDFPLLDVLTANREFQSDDAEAFMQQYNLPLSMKSFVAKNVMLLQSAKMINLLQPYYDDGSINADIGHRAMLSLFLNQSRVLEWNDILVRVLLHGRSSERGKQTDFYRRLRGSQSVLEALDRQFSDIFGVSIGLMSEVKVEKIVQVFKYNAIVQNLAVVQADNYKALRIKSSIALQKLNQMLSFITEQSKLKQGFEELLQELGTSIRCDEIVRWYGPQADYYYIPEDLCLDILKSILTDDISSNYGKVSMRVATLLSRHAGSDATGVLFDFISHVSRYYELAAALGSLSRNTPDDYIRFYETDFFRIDQIYRQTVGLYYDLLNSNNTDIDIQPVKKSMDLHYAKLTNRLNLEWSGCLKDAGGLGAIKMMRQREFFDTYVKPESKKVAVIVCDALRYEMACQIVEALSKTKHKPEILAAMATLPTETKYCKPPLLPHRSLKLVENGDDVNMGVDDRILPDIDKRSEHLRKYSDDALCVQFETLAKYDLAYNREIFRHPLVYIFHNAIDEVGHSGSTSKAAAGCQQEIRNIVTMVTRIHASYNVTEVIVTSDHGFLFNDIEFEDKDKQKVVEEALEQKTRYYLTRSDAAVMGVMKFPLSEVSGMDNAGNVMVVVPVGTNRFAAPSGGYAFTHGGASLQELIIPIIVSRQGRVDVKTPVDVAVLDRKLSMLASRLRFKLLQTEAVGPNSKERTITIALYYNDEAVSPIKKIVLDKTDSSLDCRVFPLDLTLNRNVDAKVLQLRVYDVEDENNPLIKENVTNNTLIENDFDF